MFFFLFCFSGQEDFLTAQNLNHQVFDRLCPGLYAFDVFRRLDLNHTILQQRPFWIQLIFIIPSACIPWSFFYFIFLSFRVIPLNCIPRNSRASQISRVTEKHFIFTKVSLFWDFFLESLPLFLGAQPISTPFFQFKFLIRPKHLQCHGAATGRCQEGTNWNRAQWMTVQNWEKGGPRRGKMIL